MTVRTDYSDPVLIIELSASNTTHPLLQTVKDSKVDVAPLEVGLTSQRFSFLDFTNPVTFAEIHIISKRIDANEIREFLLDIYDFPTMICILLSFVLMTCIIYFSQNKYSLTSIVFHSFGAALNQGFPMKMKLGTLAFVFTLIAMIITTIFSGLIISQLMKKTPPKHVDNLTQLRKAPFLKIIIVNQSYIQDIFATSPNLQDLQSRIEYQNVDITNIDSLKGENFS